MANVKVSELTEYTGTADDVYALVSKQVGGVQTSYKFNLGNIGQSTMQNVVLVGGDASTPNT